MRDQRAVVVARRSFEWLGGLLLQCTLPRLYCVCDRFGCFKGNHVAEFLDQEQSRAGYPLLEFQGFLMRSETVSPERYLGVGGCELQTWRQGARRTLAVISQEACLAAYCTARMRDDILSLPIAVDLRPASCSD